MNLPFDTSPDTLKRIAWTALFAGLAAFVAVYSPLASGFQNLKNFEEGKAAVLALWPTALGAFVGAVISAIKNAIVFKPGHPKR